MVEQKPAVSPERVIRVRKLVALDIALHGYRFIVAEFVLGIAFCVALGLWIILSGASADHVGALTRFVIGGYFLCLAINYVPMLWYAIALTWRHSAREEVAAELAESRFPRRYAVQQLLLVVPLAIPLLAIVQAWRPAHAHAE